MRLAYEQGLFQRPTLNRFQRWALRYHMSVKRWFLAEVEEDFLKQLAFVFNPSRFAELFVEPERESLPISANEFDDVERYLDSLERMGGSASAADVPEDEGWV